MAGLDAKVALARAVAGGLRLSGRGGGTSLPGKVLLRLEPHAIGALAARLPDGTAVISATNGKTTTAAMVARILERRGRRIVHNAHGANMAGGIASTLLAGSRRGRPGGDLGLFEVDEFWLGSLVGELAPRALLLANLFRDQLDRYGELDTIADRWASVVTGTDARLVLNADDPLIADLGRRGLDGIRDGVTYFGIEDPAVALDGLEHASDSTHCRNCGHPYGFTAVYMGHLGRYRCPNCGRSRPTPAVAARDVRLEGTRGARFELTTPEGGIEVEIALPGLYNVYNAVAAAALCRELGAGLEEIRDGLAATRAAFGRAERLTLAGVELQLLLIKNPAGANEVLRTLALESDRLVLLGVLNDRIADGRDVSWIWDADWERLAPHVDHAVLAGTRAAELGLRLKYAGAPAAALEVIPALGPALDRALELASDRGGGRLWAVPTYTAMLELRSELTARGHVSAYWETAP